MWKVNRLGRQLFIELDGGKRVLEYQTESPVGPQPYEICEAERIASMLNTNHDPLLWDED